MSNNSKIIYGFYSEQDYNEANHDGSVKIGISQKVISDEHKAYNINMPTITGDMLVTFNLYTADVSANTYSTPIVNDGHDFRGDPISATGIQGLLILNNCDSPIQLDIADDTLTPIGSSFAIASNGLLMVAPWATDEHHIILNTSQASGTGSANITVLY